MTTQKFLIPTLMFGVFATLTIEFGAMGIIPIIAREFSVSVADAGWVVSIFALVVAFSAPIAPLLMAKYNPQRVMLICLAVFVLTSIVSAFITNFSLLLFMRTIPAFFHPIYVALAFSIAAKSVCKTEAVKATSKIFMAISAGMMLGVPITSYIASETSLEMGFAFFAVINAIAFVATIFFVKAQSYTAQTKSQKSQFYILSNPVVLISIGIAILLMGAVNGFYSYLSEFLLNVSHFDFRIISVALFFFGVSWVFGNFLAGGLLSTKTNKTLFVTPFIAIGLCLMLFFFGEIPTLSIVVMMAYGVFCGILHTSSHFMLTNPAPQAREFTNGLFISAANIGTSLGTMLCGFFITLKGSRFSVLAAVTLIIATIVMVFIRAYLKK